MTLATGRVGAALVLVLLTIATAPAGAQPAAPTADVVPPGTTTLVEDAAWSWFGDARVAFTGGGSTLATSAVTGPAATAALPGTVVLAELDLATGARRLDGTDDIHWYAVGAADHLWWSGEGPLASTEPAAVDL